MQCFQSVQSFAPCPEAPFPAVDRFRIDSRVGPLLRFPKQGREGLWRPQTSGWRRLWLVTSCHEKEQGAIFAKSALQLPLNDLTSGVSKHLLSAVPNIESNSKHRFCTVVTWSNAHAQIHQGISSSLSQPLELFDRVAHILDVHVPLHYLNILYICQTLALHLRFRIEL